MSQTQLPPVDQAYNTLLERVKYPVFFAKLAQDWGIVPQNQIDAENLIKMAERLSTAKMQEQTKQASAGNGFLSSALQGLEQVLGTSQASTSNHEELHKSAAFEKVSEDSELAYAALAYAQHIAAMEQGQ